MESCKEKKMSLFIKVDLYVDGNKIDSIRASGRLTEDGQIEEYLVANGRDSVPLDECTVASFITAKVAAEIDLLTRDDKGETVTETDFKAVIRDWNENIHVLTRAVTHNDDPSRIRIEIQTTSGWIAASDIAIADITMGEFESVLMSAIQEACLHA